MLAANKSGLVLLEYMQIEEKDIWKYNVTGAFAIVKVGDRYLFGFNNWRKQWEIPAGGMSLASGPSPRGRAIAKADWRER